jgi:hypothetical protein
MLETTGNRTILILWDSGIGNILSIARLFRYGIKERQDISP